MADNVPVTAGTGTSIATDDISSVHYPRHKITLGANGVNDGDVSSSNPMPVTPAVASEAAYDAMVTKAYTFFTASFQAVTLIDSGSGLIMEIWNDTDANMIGSFDGGVTEHFIVPARAAKTVSWASAGRKESTDIQMKYGSAPSTGNVYFEVIK